MITGKLEITIKINELPEAIEVQNGWKQFHIDCNGRSVQVTVKPKVWKKLTDAAESFPQWVAAIGGQMGAPIKGGFILENPGIQVFEKKPKPE
jgi:hypothetical protein